MLREVFGLNLLALVKFNANGNEYLYKKQHVCEGQVSTYAIYTFILQLQNS